MSKGYALHIGLNQVDKKHYGWDGLLQFAIADAEKMSELSRHIGIEKPTLLTNESATRQNITENLYDLSRQATAEDFVLITYSGHGGYLPDKNYDERNGYDESWCLYDGMLIDDEIYYHISQFTEGVRVLFISDSCHSGTVTRDVPKPSILHMETALLSQGYKPKYMPRDVNIETYTRNQSFYQKLLTDPTLKDTRIQASVKLLAGCKDEQKSYEGFGNGEFTMRLLEVWNDGNFEGNYKQFIKNINRLTPKIQTPVMFELGLVNPLFDHQKPFEIKISAVRPFKKRYKKGESPYADTPSTPPPANLAVKPSQNLATHTPSVVEAKQVRLLVRFKETPKDNAPFDALGFEVIQNKSQSLRQVWVVQSQQKFHNAWEIAHELYDYLSKQGYIIDSIEPDIEHTLYKTPPKAKGSELAEGVFLKSWPYPTTYVGNFGWHLGDDYSQLAKARDTVMQDDNLNKKIRIAHFDTGYHPNHPGKPAHILFDLAKSFVKGEENNPAVDLLNDGKGQQGHGCATLAILAGGFLTEEQTLIEKNGEMVKSGFSGYIGGAPFAEILPLRLQDSVVLWKTEVFEQAVHYAVENGCEVITMSMAGLPSQRWADAVNYAYEKGVTIVTAAGNSWRKGLPNILPKCLLYPARFDRVIAATGVSHNAEPYDFDANSWSKSTKSIAIESEDMQGNWGPIERMTTALAGYTPNVFWTFYNNENSKGFSLAGAGTSSATPQVAAAAAIWIVKNRGKLKERDWEGTWKQVEAVRYALFNTAQKPAHYDGLKYLGNGLLKAYDALNIFPPDDYFDNDNHKSPPAKIKLPLFELFLGGKDMMSEFAQNTGKLDMISVELLQWLFDNVTFYDLLESNFENIEKFVLYLSPEKRAALDSAIQNSNLSQLLKNFSKEAFI